MEPLLFLAHRIPYPPNKGDKIRSFHLLRFLATRYRVHLGTFIDREEDRAHEAALDAFCESKLAVMLDLRAAKLRSVAGFVTGEALTLPYYRSAELRRWVEQHGRGPFASARPSCTPDAMAQYVRDLGLHVVLDFVDVDSAKWTQYAERHAWPSSFVYRREGAKLLSFERRRGGKQRGERVSSREMRPICSCGSRRSFEAGSMSSRTALTRNISLRSRNVSLRIHKDERQSFSPARWTTGRT